jgi:hypothetical protein
LQATNLWIREKTTKGADVRVEVELHTTMALIQETIYQLKQKGWRVNNLLVSDNETRESSSFLPGIDPSLDYHAWFYLDKP